MNLVTLLLGAVALSFGLYTLYLRGRSPEKFRKLEAMKKQWGPGIGNTVHLIAYSILPIVVGVILLTAGWLGVAIF
jgi:multisubunit Na+/H+ antiporter MnhB subunit